MRIANIFYDTMLAGKLIEMNDGDYTFTYAADYVKNFPNQFITFSMPVRSEFYINNRLFPFF